MTGLRLGFLTEAPPVAALGATPAWAHSEAWEPALPRQGLIGSSARRLARPDRACPRDSAAPEGGQTQIRGGREDPPSQRGWVPWGRQPRADWMAPWAAHPVARR